MRTPFLLRNVIVFFVMGLLWSCSANKAYVHRSAEPSPDFAVLEQEGPGHAGQSREIKGSVNEDAGIGTGDMSWTRRVLTEGELQEIAREDPQLSPSISRRILARLNARAPYYIAEDIQNGNPLKVPNDFRSFKHWNPMPQFIQELTEVPRFILIVKDIPFLGWYEKGMLVGSTEICIGKESGWTRSGLYSVEEKDVDHVSGSYKNAYGVPAPMPWALRIYGRVWIHAGDIASGYCSHGCINLPLVPAVKVFQWAERGTPVLIVKSVAETETALENNRSNCSLLARACQQRQSGGY